MKIILQFSQQPLLLFISVTLLISCAAKRGEDLNSLDRQLYFLEAKDIKLTRFNIGNNGLKEAELEILQAQRLYNIEEMGSEKSPRRFRFKSQSIKKVNVSLSQSVDKKWFISGGIHHVAP